MIEFRIKIDVFIDKKKVGYIKSNGDKLFRYYPKGSESAPGAGYTSPEACMMSVVGDDNAFIVDGKLTQNKKR